MTNMWNSIETCETCVSLKKELIDLHETLHKFTKGKENFDLILSSYKPSLNKSWLGFKLDKTPSNGLNRKKRNLLI